MKRALFDSRIRTDVAYARHHEDWYGFLDRAANDGCGSVRETLNEWFAELPDLKATAIRSAFTSRTPSNVESAFWELYLHAALVRTPFRVALDVAVGSGANIDFVPTPAREESPAFSADAVVVGDPAAVRARARRLSAAWDAVNQAAATDFFVWIVRVEQEGARAPSGTKLRKEILPWLETLDREAAVRDAQASPVRSRLPERVFQVDDWRFLVRAVPLSDDAAARADPRRRLVGVQPMESAWGGATRAIRSGLDRKRASKYDSLELPYVIALLDLHRFSSGEEDLDAQLFGSEAIRLSLAGDAIVATEAIRKGDGFWTPSRNTRVSAVLYAHHLAPWTIGRVTPQLWINPWARRPITTDIPWATRVEVGGEGELVRTPARVEPASHFSLPVDWPGWD